MATSSITPGITLKAHQLVGLLLMLLVASISSPTTVNAHATLIGTTPGDGEHLDSSPAEIMLEFSEPVGPVDGGTVLHGSGMDPVTMLAESVGSSVVIQFDAPLDDGAYILQWRVISADSHPISGTVSFSVGEADAYAVTAVESDAPAWIEWMRSGAVALKYLGLLAAFGLLLVGWRLVPADVSVGVKLATRFAALGLTGMLLELPFSAMIHRGSATSNPSILWSAITDLDSGTRFAALTGIASLGLLLVSTRLARNWHLPVALMLVAILTLILGGHTRTQEPIWLMMLSDSVHVITAGVWLGGIILLTLGLCGRWRGKGFHSAESRFAAVSRFSAFAGYTALMVIVSGAAMALVILDSFEALFQTGYGVTLLIKVGLVAVLVLIATANRFWLIPVKERKAEFSMSWLRRLVAIELVLLITVAGVTSSLVHRDPNVQAEVAIAPQTSGTVYEGESALDSTHTIRMRVKLTTGSQVTITATIIDENRNIVLPDTDLDLTWYLPERDLGPLNQNLTLDPETGAYIGEFVLPSSGSWELGIRADLDRFTDSRTTVEVIIPD